MRRFYEAVQIVAAEGGFAVELDGSRLRTPAKNTLLAPTQNLADAIAAEWSAQDGEIEPTAMPLTRLANSALDRTPRHRESILAEIASYAETDLVCYRTDDPPDLAERQAEIWQPLLDWVAQRHGAALEVVTGIVPARHPVGAITAIRAAVDGLDDFRLTAFHETAAVSGSVVIALALAGGRVDAASAWQAASLDEMYQAGRWGEDALATEQRAGAERHLLACAAFLAGLDGAG